MSAYSSPVSLETPNTFKASGPLGGFLAGMNQDLANQMIMQNMKDTNLDNATKQQALDLANATQQDKIDDSAATAAKARQDSGYYNSGDYSAMRTSNDSAKSAENSAIATKAGVEQKMAAAPLWQQMAEEMKSLAPNGLDPMNAQHRAWYAGWYDKMHQYAPNMPPGFPDQGDQMKIAQQGVAASQFTQAMGAGANVKHNQAMEQAAVAPTITAAGSLATEKARAASNETIGAAHDQRYLDVQNLKQAHDDLSKRYEERNSKIIERAQKTGVIDDIAVGATAEQAQKEINDDLKSDGSLRLLLIGKEEGERKQILHQLIAEKMERILPGSTKQKVGGDQTVTPPGGGDLQKAVESSGIKYEPDKYDYRVQGGKVQRKPK